MEAKELRIGNVLLCAKRDIPYRVTAEDILEIDNGSSKSRYVQLTEEILLKCKGTIDAYIYKGWDEMHFFRFDEYSANMFELEICSDGLYYGCNKIEFLHDLQNCYYFHENRKKELTVNL